MHDLLDALRQPHAQLVLRLVLGGLLLLAGLAKLADRAGTLQAVAEYALLPKRWERPFAFVLPWVETALGGALLLGLGTTVVAALAVPLFLSFAFAIGVNVLRGRSFDCHCFGAVQREQIGTVALVRSCLLTLAALVVAVGASRFGALDAVLFGAPADLPSPGEVVPAVFLALVVLDVLVLLPEAVAFKTGFDRAYRARLTGAHRHHAHNGHRAEASTMEVRGLS